QADQHHRNKIRHNTLIPKLDKYLKDFPGASGNSSKDGDKKPLIPSADDYLNFDEKPKKTTRRSNEKGDIVATNPDGKEVNLTQEYVKEKENIKQRYEEGIKPRNKYSETPQYEQTEAPPEQPTFFPETPTTS